MADTIFFNGKVIATPGSYSVVDASALEQTGLGANGILAIVGTAEGGVPYTALGNDASGLQRINNPAQVRTTFRSGDLREACAMAFNPSNDPQIQGGAQQIVPVKVNPATQSSATLSDLDATVATVTSQDYGAFTSQINIAVAAGSNLVTNSKLITVNFENTTESFDNLGGTDIFTLEYNPPVGTGWGTMAASVLPSGVQAIGTQTFTGQATSITNQITSGQHVTVASSSAGDTSQYVTIYGRNLSNLPVKETLRLNGTTTVVGVQTWSAVYGATLSAAAAGTVTLTDPFVPDTILSFAPSVLTQAVTLTSVMFLANTTLQLSVDSAISSEVHIWGRTPSGAVQTERVILTGAVGQDFISTAGTWSQIDAVVLGNVANARTLTLAGQAGLTSNTVQKTVQSVADYFNGRAMANVTPGSPNYGFNCVVVTSNTTFATSSLDLTEGPGVNIYNVAVGHFQANLQAIINAVATSSTLVTISRIAYLPQINTITITAVNGATYTVTTNGTTVTYTASGSATVFEIQTALINLILRNPTLAQIVTAVAVTGGIEIIGVTPANFANTVGANLALAATQAVAGAGNTPTITVDGQPIYLTGGIEGVATFTDYQTALNILKQVLVNSVVVLTGSPAVQAALEAHCDFMCGIGRAERDGFVGLSALDMNGNPTGALPTKTSMESQIKVLNTRHLRAFGQTIDRFDTSGNLTTFSPWFTGVIAAGMQAGASVGTSLTHKFANVNAIHQSSTWNPVDDSEELIQSGLCFLENKDGLGIRFVRNITTYLQSNNLAFIEASVNQAANYATFNFRTAMEFIVGQKGFAGTVKATKGAAVGQLNKLMSSGAVVDYQSLSLTLTLDVLEVSVELAPVIPINFVESTIHLVASQSITA